MGDRYVSDSGTPSAPYETWADAAADIVTALDAAADGEKIFVDSAMTDTISSTTTYSGSTDLANPNHIISVDQTGDPEPPLVGDYLRGALLTNSGGTGSFTQIRGHLTWHGIDIDHPNGSIFLLSTVAGHLVFKDCLLDVDTANTARTVEIGSGGNAQELLVEWINTNIVLNDSAVTEINFASCELRMFGGSVTANTTGHTSVVQFGGGNKSPQALFVGVDLTEYGTGDGLIQASADSGSAIFKDCQLSSGAALFTAAPTAVQAYGAMFNCTSGDTTYEFQIETAFGDIVPDTTTKLDATDGVTGSSWLMTTNASAGYSTPLRSNHPIEIWNTAVGSSVTLTVEVTTDTTLNDGDFGFLLEYLGTNTKTLGTVVDTGFDEASTTKNILGSSALTTSSASWTSAGTNKYKIEESFTPQSIGMIRIFPWLGKPSVNVNVEPKLSVV